MTDNFRREEGAFMVLFIPELLHPAIQILHMIGQRFYQLSGIGHCTSQL